MSLADGSNLQELIEQLEKLESQCEQASLALKEREDELGEVQDELNELNELYQKQQRRSDNCSEARGEELGIYGLEPTVTSFRKEVCLQTMLMTMYRRLIHCCDVD